MRDGLKIKALSILVGAILWVIDAIIDPGSSLFEFGRILAFGSSPHDLIMRVFILASFATFGFIAAGMFERQASARRALDEKSAYLDNILRSTAEFGVITTGTDLSINYFNPMAERLFGKNAEDALGRNLKDLRINGSRPFEMIESAIEAAKAGNEHVYLMTMEAPDGARSIESRVFGIFNAEGKLIGYANFSRDITTSIRSEQERDQLIERLREAVGSVKTLSGLLPICSYCKKIRDNEGQWSQIETYIRKRSEADFTHSICPECVQREIDVLDREGTNP